MVELKPGSWYLSKKGYLCRVDALLDNGEVAVTVHYTGTRISVPMEQAEFFTATTNPDIPPGTAMIRSTTKKNNAYDNVYRKYPHIIEGSIYSVQSTNTPNEKIIKVDGRVRVKKEKIAKGSTRCKIRCQMLGCKNIRDIKVQDAFQVTCCLGCKNKKKKKDLEKFLKKVKP